MLVFIKHFGIYLSSGKLTMAKEFRDCIDVSSKVEHHYCEGVTSKMETKSKSIKKQICAGETQPVENKRFFIILPYR